MKLITTDMLKRLFLPMVLFFAVVFFYAPFLHSWFLLDDTQWLSFSAANHPLWKIFFDSSTYLTITRDSFTPMLGLSFKLDWLLFKMDPIGYNLHSTISMLATSAMLYILLERFVGRIVAFCACLLFVANASTLTVAGWHSTRHYMDGMFWALLSAFMFLEGERRRKTSFLMISVMAFIFAALNKEVFLILPVFFFLFIGGGTARRLRKTLFFWAFLVLYVPWRWFMLGGYFGGYQDYHRLSAKWLINSTLQAVILPLKYVYGEYWYFAAGALAFCLILLLMSRRWRRKLATFLGMYFLVLSPVTLVMGLTSVSDMLGARFAFHITTFLIIMAALAYGAMKDNRVLRLSIAGLFIFSVPVMCTQALKTRDALAAEKETSRQETLRFASDPEYMRAVFPTYYYDGLRKIYGGYYGRQINTKLFREDSVKYNDPAVIRRIFGDGAVYYLGMQKALEKGPLSCDISWHGRTVEWHFTPDSAAFKVYARRNDEPYCDPTYLKSSGRLVLSEGTILYIRVVGRLHDGREVVSPEMVISLSGDGHIKYGS
jgi:hypothetical protein